ncbi:Sulfate transporter 2.1, partial [Cucurbita argyrosperma subsp. argyrosperma]
MSVANADISPTMLESSTVRDIPALDIDKCSPADRAEWVTNPPEPPGIWRDLLNSLRDTMFPNPTKLFSPKRNTGIALLGTLLQAVFPILSWGRSYNLAMFKHDIFSGLTLASLCIPQSIGYANLAKLDPQYGLYTSIVPPLVYAVLGTSREIAIGPVAIVSLLLPSLIGKIQDPAADPLAYRNLIFTTTFFAGIFQAAFGFLRLGFLVDFLSHAAIVGFMGGAAIVIGLQQLKGLLGLTHFTNKTDIISVLEAVFGSFRHENTRWNPLNFIIGCSFLSFILITRLLHGVKIVKRVPAGLNPISTRHLQFHSPQISQITTASLIVAVIALTEAIAVGRSFASMKGYTIDGNREMVALGCMNLAGSLTSCYTATGSFSRTAVNFTAGCQTAVSNIVMAVTVMISLEIILISIKPGTEILGKLPGTDTFGDIHQYPMALNTPGVLILRVKSSLLCFANANFIKDRILRMISNEEDASGKRAIQFLVIDLSNLMNIDTSGIGSLEELQNGLGGSGVELAIANPKWEVIHKLRVANFVGKLKGKVFLSVGEAVDACVAAKLGAMI